MEFFFMLAIGACVVLLIGTIVNETDKRTTQSQSEINKQRLRAQWQAQQLQCKRPSQQKGKVEEKRKADVVDMCMGGVVDSMLHPDNPEAGKCKLSH